MIVGIGQGSLLVTPLQLATMTARLVNGAFEVVPTFFPVSDKRLLKIKKIKVSDSYLDLVKQGMFEVVNYQHGTAWRSRFDYNGMKMAGKTGSVQVRRITLQERQQGIVKQEDLPWKYRDHAIFIGYAPADNPKYAVAVLVEHGGGGSTAAAPIASQILKNALILDPVVYRTH